jgi:hypothetical protein
MTIARYKWATIGKPGLGDMREWPDGEYVTYADHCREIEEILARLYISDEKKPSYFTVAALCDEVLDRSGALLGRVRDRADAIRQEAT